MHNSNTQNAPTEQTLASPHSANQATARKSYQAPRLEHLATTATQIDALPGDDGSGVFTAS